MGDLEVLSMGPLDVQSNNHSKYTDIAELSRPIIEGWLQRTTQS